ncbi:MAG: type II toxin-antitoxin system RelB/DinJ family antitoxin [Ruminococcus sp.]|nr:type II toxin-antitoxin system RelB/DinJ family antitoxin [Ruminococcus sp.]MEE1171350.1 type II toxin-antitoxin system RelB/DinJ family antitoxin [Ruminococcus sp.]
MNIIDAPKTGTFQMRINPEIKKQLENLYAKCGMTLTDAVNAFFQQSLNVGGLPFLMNQNSKETLRQQAIELLLSEIAIGEKSVSSEADWISEEDMLSEFGVQA